MADDSATIVVNPLPPRRRDIVIAHLAAPTAGAEFFYFIEDSGEIATSPIRAGDFVSLLASGRGTPSTLVWAQSLGEWTALRNVPALASMVALSDVLASSPSLASENETNDPSIVVQSDVSELPRIGKKHVRMCRHEDVSRHHLRNERQAHGAHGQELGAQEAAQDARRHLFSL